jgi:nucleotide-binding universal stress UspA family protein
MYDKIIISLALDHGISQRALHAARDLLNDGGEIVAVHVYEPMRGTAAAYVSEEDVAESFAVAKAKLAERMTDTPDVEAVMLKGHSGRAINDYAAKVGADCIIVGSHKPGLRDFFLGSTAARTVRYAPCSVLVLR